MKRYNVFNSVNIKSINNLSKQQLIKFVSDYANNGGNIRNLIISVFEPIEVTTEDLLNLIK